LAHAIKRRLHFGDQLLPFQDKDYLGDFQAREPMTSRYLSKAPIIREEMIDGVCLRHGDDLPIGPALAR
jgi:hypothetical protein